MLKINLPKASMMTSPNPLSLVCTKKEDGTTNIATVSWYTYLSYNPGMIGFAIQMTLKDYIEVGDHYLYICDVEQVYGNENEEALFAWNGYSKIASADIKK